MIRTKLFIGLALTVIVFGVLSAFIGVRLIQDRVVKEAQTRVDLDLNAAWSVYNARLDEIETVLKLSAGDQLLMRVCETGQWPNSEVQNRLAIIRVNFNLDFLSIVSSIGRVELRTTPPYTTGDFHSSSPVIQKALEGDPVVATTLLSGNELDLEGEELAETAFMVLEETPHARPSMKQAESRGMAMIGAVPIKKANQVLGVIYGGVLLNRNHRIVDAIKDSVFKDAELGESPSGTVTIFLHDSRIATTVRLENGNRALGTRVSKEVADRVLDNGKRWDGRAFVVRDWYLTAYDPILDSRSGIIGMLYVGILEKPYVDLIRNIIFRYAMLSFFGLTAALVIAFFLARRLAEPIHRLAEAAQKMHRGEKPQPVAVRKVSQETAVLIQAFNEMVNTLDIREKNLRDTLQKLERANASLTSLNRSYMETVGFISHELQNPLATILNYVYLVRQSKSNPLSGEQERLFEKIESSIDLLVEMVHHYLDLSRIENGEFEPVRKRVELLEEVVNPVIESYERSFREKNLTFTNAITKEIVLYSDLTLTREIYENLISNAVKYGREGGAVRLESSESDGFVCLSVFNEGEGIPSAKTGDLFKKFSRLGQQGLTRKQRGSGLGLFITKHIVEAHGGRISVESREGEWVRFTFTLPQFVGDEDKKV